MSLINPIVSFLKNTWLFQSFVFCTYTLLSNVNDVGITSTKWYEILLVLGVLLFYWWLIFIVLNFILKSTFRSTYLTTFVTFSSLFFFAIQKSLFFTPMIKARYVILFILILFLILLMIGIKAKRINKKPNKKIMLYLNTLFLILIVQNSIGLVYPIFSKLVLTQKLDFSQKETESNPDIYLIILDGYTNQKSLKKYWNYDNKHFLSELSNFGFYYAANSKSNYSSTVKTIASMLNLNYLEPDERENGIGLLKKIRQNNTTELLYNKRYSIYNFSVVEIDRTKNNYAINFFSDIPRLYVATLSTSIYAFLISYLMPKFPQINTNRELNILKSMEPVITSKVESPKFVLYHSMLTHFPYYLNEEGKTSKEIEQHGPRYKVIQDWLVNKKGYYTIGSAKKDSLWMKGYLNHLSYTNSIILKLVKNIFKSNHRPPIIVLLSDHGFRFILNRSIEQIESEKYSNFCAIYYPDKNYKNLYDSITPINVMRLVLNKALSMPIKPLKDQSGL